MYGVHAPLRVLNLVLDMDATKTGYRALRRFWAEVERTLRSDGTNVGFEVPSRTTFNATWDECAVPLDLHWRKFGTINGVYWPLASWAEYVSSKPVFQAALSTENPGGQGSPFLPTWSEEKFSV